MVDHGGVGGSGSFWKVVCVSDAYPSAPKPCLEPKCVGKSPHMAVQSDPKTMQIAISRHLKTYGISCVGATLAHLEEARTPIFFCLSSQRLLFYDSADFCLLRAQNGDLYRVVFRPDCFQISSISGQGAEKWRPWGLGTV